MYSKISIFLLMVVLACFALKIYSEKKNNEEEQMELAKYLTTSTTFSEEYCREIFADAISRLSRKKLGKYIYYDRLWETISPKMIEKVKNKLSMKIKEYITSKLTHTELQYGLEQFRTNGYIHESMFNNCIESIKKLDQQFKDQIISDLVTERNDIGNEMVEIIMNNL